MYVLNIFRKTGFSLIMQLFLSSLVGFVFFSQKCLCYELSQYIGCFNDDYDRAMEYKRDFRNDNSIDKCIEACQRNGYTFAGLQYEYICFCGDSYDKHGLAATTEQDPEPCHYSCRGDSNETCGGDWKNSVYSVCPPSRYGLNCAQECESFGCQPASCQYRTGSCLYEQCDRNNSYCQKDCYTLKADPRKEPGRLNSIPDRQLNIFPDSSFTKAGTVSEVQYFAYRSGNVFVSFWREVRTYEWQFIGKILLTSPGSGLQRALIPQSDRVYVRKGDILAIHYPEQGQGVIYQEVQSSGRTPGIRNNDLKRMFYVSVFDTAWPQGHLIDYTGYDYRTAAIHITLDCITECVNCEAGFCDKETGECTQCIPGYLGNRCQQECTDGFYGIHCQSRCSPQCIYQPCEKFSLYGECPSGLCQPGYMRNNCTEECPDGAFGAGCEKICPDTCLQPVCVKTNGFCKDGRCQPGYNGQRCETDCVDGFHGENCLQECSSHCKVKINSCNKYSNQGECPGNSCDPGYMGNNCKTACLDGFYGENCTGVCSGHCLPGPCMKNSTDGQCQGNDCEIGYQGARCDQECSPGFYGMGCEGVCSEHCQFPPCIATTGQCPQKACLEGYFGDDCTATPPVVMKSGLIAAVVVICVLLVLTSAAIAVCCILRRRRKKQKGSGGAVEQHAMLEIKQSTLSLEYTDKPSDTSNRVYQTSDGNRENNCIYLNDLASPTAIQVKQLGSYITNLKQQKHGFEKEYKRLPNDTSSTSEAAIPELRIKNRYKNILPYNDNRVQLSKQDGDLLSQYINASFIKDYNDKQTYIASLAPTASTLADFWRMIWEHNVLTVFMLTNLVELGKMKSEQYWPKEKEVTYGEITVSKKYEQSVPEYVTRTLLVTKGDETRTVSQHQYTHWPDKSVPENVGGVYKLRELMNQCKSDGKPILVHCSAGVGRTGTFIALDILMEQAVQRGFVDVFQCVKQLRHQRSSMVQTQVQYQFLYVALCEILTVGMTTIPCAELSARLSHMTPEFKQQYDYLEKHRIQKISEGSENNNNLSTDNTGGDEPKKGKGPSHFKTVHVMGYSPTVHYLAGQMPSPEQVADFWDTLYTEQLHTVVCLEQSPTKWLPGAGSELSVAGYEVTCTDSTDKEGGLLTMELSVTPIEDVVYANVTHSNKSVKVKVIQQTPVDNSSSHNPAQRLISLHLESKLSGKQGVNEKPLLVLCRDGFTECGMYLTSCLLLEMADTEQQVDIFHTVSKIRKAEPRFITSLEQYIQLHNIVERYIGQFQEYSNFK